MTNATLQAEAGAAIQWSGGEAVPDNPLATESFKGGFHQYNGDRFARFNKREPECLGDLGDD